LSRIRGERQDGKVKIELRRSTDFKPSMRQVRLLECPGQSGGGEGGITREEKRGYILGKSPCTKEGEKDLHSRQGKGRLGYFTGVAAGALRRFLAGTIVDRLGGKGPTASTGGLKNHTTDREWKTGLLGAVERRKKSIRERRLGTPGHVASATRS